VPSFLQILFLALGFLHGVRLEHTNDVQKPQSILLTVKVYNQDILQALFMAAFSWFLIIDVTGSYTESVGERKSLKALWILQEFECSTWKLRVIWQPAEFKSNRVRELPKKYSVSRFHFSSPQEMSTLYRYLIHADYVNCVYSDLCSVIRFWFPVCSQIRTKHINILCRQNVPHSKHTPSRF
jgi:hypothetical protein